MQGHGVISRTQLLANGISSNEVQRHLRGGRWRRIRAGIYATSCDGSSEAWLADFAGELCWGGEEAAISHRAAAYLYGLDGFLQRPSGRPDIVVGASSACRGANVHRSTMNMPRVRVFELTVVSPEVCLAQLGHRSTEAEVEGAVESALRHGITTVERLHEVAYGSLARIEGARALRAVLRRRPPGAAATANGTETSVLQILRTLGCRQLERGVSIGAEEFSFVIRRRRLAVSCSSGREVPTPSTRRHGLAETGWTIVELCQADLVADPEAVAQTLQAALVRTQRGPVRVGRISHLRVLPDTGRRIAVITGAGDHSLDACANERVAA